MAGDATAAQIGGLLVALKMKGEHVDECRCGARDAAGRHRRDEPARGRRYVVRAAMVAIRSISRRPRRW
jgi:anthranilate phosphoribosyltransferase